MWLCAALPDRLPLLNCVSRIRPGDHPGGIFLPLFGGTWPFLKQPLFATLFLEHSGPARYAALLPIPMRAASCDTAP